MSEVEATLALLVGIPVLVAVLAALGAAGIFLAATVYAFIKPHVSHLVDAYIDWYERRTQ